MNQIINESYGNIINPKTKEKIPINSEDGNKLLFSYVEQFKKYKNVLNSITSFKYNKKNTVNK